MVLTERTEHLAAIEVALGGRVEDLVTLQGRSSNKQRVAALARLEALAPGAPRVLLSTGKLVGEGFDHPPLDTLVLAMPISWRGRSNTPDACTASTLARRMCRSWASSMQGTPR